MAISLREVHASHEDLRWRPRPWAAVGLWVAALGSPILAALAVAVVAGHLVAAPHGGVGLWTWRAMIMVLATTASFVVERRLRHVVSLATLLKLSLVFPDHAPSRYSVALRTGTPRQLRRRLSDLAPEGSGADEQGAATRLLELVSALNAHDRLTRGHSERVRAYARLIGQELKLADDDLDRLNWSALLHDIGKLEVPAEILTAPGKLTDEQWLAIKRHPEAGSRIIAPLQGWLGPWADAVLDHHERWEGGGYPRGIAGSDISLGGRILAVADAFDVMTSARSYQRPRSAAAGREELLRCSGTQFDPTVVRAFINVSVGHLRLVIGPLSWFAQLPVLSRLPLGAIAGDAVSAAVVTTTLALGSVLGAAPAPLTQSAAKISAARGETPRPVTDRSSGSVASEPTATPTEPALAPGPRTGPRPDSAGGGTPTAEVPDRATPVPGDAPITVPADETSPVPGDAPSTAPADGTAAATTTATPAPPAAQPTTTTVPVGQGLVAGDDAAAFDGAKTNSVVIPIRSNDRDSDHHSFEVISVSPAGHGDVEILSNGSLRYTLTEPADRDSFTYTIRCEAGDTATATVTVTIAG